MGRKSYRWSCRLQASQDPPAPVSQNAKQGHLSDLKTIKRRGYSPPPPSFATLPRFFEVRRVARSLHDYEHQRCRLDVSTCPQSPARKLTLPTATVFQHSPGPSRGAVASAAVQSRGRRLTLGVSEPRFIVFSGSHDRVSEETAGDFHHAWVGDSDSRIPEFRVAPIGAVLLTWIGGE